jgi:hypothetical protein
METADLVTALMRRQPRKADEPIFVNRYGEPLTASGFRFRLREYVDAAARTIPTIAKKRVTPHVFRHSTAVHLVAAGVDVTVIRSWLGHAQLDTTNHYAQANLETKRKALEQVDPKLRPAKPPRWKRDADLLAWLDARRGTRGIGPLHGSSSTGYGPCGSAVEHMWVDPNNPQVLFIAEGGNLQRYSLHGGSGGQGGAPSSGPVSMAFDPFTPGTIYAATLTVLQVKVSTPALAGRPLLRGPRTRPWRHTAAQRPPPGEARSRNSTACPAED